MSKQVLVCQRLIAAILMIGWILISAPVDATDNVTQRSRPGYANLVDQVRKTVVFLGRTDEAGKPQFIATGFLVQIDGVFHLVTAKHVIADLTTGTLRDEQVVAFLNAKDGRVLYRSIKELKQRYGVSWIFHDDPHVDIAIVPFAINPNEDDVKVVPDPLFLGIERVFELYDVFFLSYQPGIEPTRRIVPIVRGGLVSIVRDDKTFYIDGFAFPGNSGSPVFLKPSPIRFDQTGISIGGDPLGGKFIGVIGEYIPYQEVAVSLQTRRPRVVFEENTGLSKVWSVDYLKEIIDSKAFQEQLRKVKGAGPPQN